MRAWHFCLIGVLVAGCDHPTDSSINYLPMANGRTTLTMDVIEPDTEAQADDASVETQACDCMTAGLWFQFDSLGLTAIDGKLHPVMNTLNPLWAADISNRELNLFLEVLEVSDTEVRASIVNGARVGTEGDVCMRPQSASEVVFGRDGCNLTLSTNGGLNIYAGDAINPKMCAANLPAPHAIPVQNVALSGIMNDTCTTVSEGVASEGLIGKGDLLGVCTCVIPLDQLSDSCEPLEPDFENSLGRCQGCNSKYQNLESLLNAFQALDYLCTDSEGAEAVCIDAFYSMVILDGTPDVCE